jgi:hypothetical protein
LGAGGLDKFDFRYGLLCSLTKKDGLCVYDCQSGEVRSQNREIFNPELFLNPPSAPIILDRNVLLLHHRALRLFSTYDTREGKTSAPRSIIGDITRHGDEIVFERTYEDHLVKARRYDGRVGDAVDWWSISAEDRPQSYHRIVSYRAYWG